MAEAILYALGEISVLKYVNRQISEAGGPGISHHAGNGTGGRETKNKRRADTAVVAWLWAGHRGAWHPVTWGAIFERREARLGGAPCVENGRGSALGEERVGRAMLRAGGWPVIAREINHNRRLQPQAEHDNAKSVASIRRANSPAISGR